MSLAVTMLQKYPHEGIAGPGDAEAGEERYQRRQSDSSTYCKLTWQSGQFGLQPVALIVTAPDTGQAAPHEYREQVHEFFAHRQFADILPPCHLVGI